MHSRTTRIVLGLWAVGVVAFLFAPLALIALYAFNASNVQSWPISGLTLRWFPETFGNEEFRAALLLSLEAGLVATTIAVTLGTAAAFAVHRFAFPRPRRGGLRRRAADRAARHHHRHGAEFGSSCSPESRCRSRPSSSATRPSAIVVVYNNVIARLRRMPRSLVEASMDLGADGFATFRRVTLPIIASAAVSGAILAFALSFDEIIVTTFTAGAQNTLPLWIFGAIRLGQRLARGECRRARRHRDHPSCRCWRRMCGWSGRSRRCSLGRRVVRACLARTGRGPVPPRDAVPVGPPEAPAPMRRTGRHRP